MDERPMTWDEVVARMVAERERAEAAEARCTALEQERDQLKVENEIAHSALLGVEQAVLGFERAGDDPDGAVVMALIAKQEAESWRAENAALRSNNARVKAMFDHRASRCQHLEQENSHLRAMGSDREFIERERAEDAEYGRQAALEALAASWDRRDELHVVTKSLDAQLINMAMRCEALTAERDRLHRKLDKIVELLGEPK